MNKSKQEDKMVKIGFTFVMQCNLTHQLKEGTVWECIEIRPANPNVPHDKERVIFVKLNEYQKPSKPTDVITINFYPESIDRYLEKGYIRTWKEF